MTPLILDVDTGIDDAFGLLYALGRVDARLLGVSTVVGNVSLAAATRNTRAVLALAGAKAPVWPGAAAPLLGSASDASDIHGETGLGYAQLPEPPAAPPAPHAVEAILHASHAHEGELVLVATGPLTNIALAVARDPELPRRLKRFVAMGGAFRDSGNVTAAAEFNIWHDPEAAEMVCRAFSAEGSAPTILVGLDVTRRCLLSGDDLATLPPGAIRTFLEDAGRFYFDLMARRGRPRALTMHDPLAVAVGLDPTLVGVETAPVVVETGGRYSRGQTLADFRGEPGGLGVALTVEAERFRADYLGAIGRLAL